MIHGIGTDLVSIARMAGLWERHGARAVDKLLAPEERDACLASADPVRFLAKRFAAKEAFAKALGTGVRAPAVLPAIAIGHDANGRPYLTFTGDLAAMIADRRLLAHLSISDEQDHALAFVVLEQA
jgi:holo-[acyl-carrier protein] synthase